MLDRKLLGIYDELEMRGFRIFSDGEGDESRYIDFREVEQQLGFQRIWIQDHTTLRLHSEKLRQARALYSNFSVAKAEVLSSRGWTVTTDFKVMGTGGDALVWPKKGRSLTHRRLEDDQKKSMIGRGVLPPATRAFIDFWVRNNKRITQIKDEPYPMLKRLIDDMKASELIGEQDISQLDGLATERIAQGEGLWKVLNPVPCLVLEFELPALKVENHASLVADEILTELRFLFETLGFRLDRFMRSKMGTRDQSKSVDRDMADQCHDLLRYKNQIILQGPPGTGKTYLAKNIAELVLTDNVSPTKKKQEENLSQLSRYKLVQFHPSYTYEDFVRGIVVNTDGPTAKYEVKDKTLALFAEEARKNPKEPYVLIIDEINRANLSSVLGELIYALEYRDEPVTSMYTRKETDETGKERDVHQLVLPEKLYIIGTMNTADRSAGHIDYAIRRRFAFVNVLPKELANEDFDNERLRFDSKLFKQVKALFTTDEYETRSEHLSEEFRPQDVALGHSYFIADTNVADSMALRLKYDIKPILLEYVKDGVLKDTALPEINRLGK
jgi:MoxR-like ATPase